MKRKKKLIRATTVSMSTTFYVDMIPDFQERGYEVVALSSPGIEMDMVREKGARVVTVPMERRMSPIKDLVSLARLVLVFLRERPYIVHSMTPKAGLLCMIASKLTGVPYRIHTFTGLVWPTSTGLSRKILMLTDKITCACASHIIPEGVGVMNDLKSHITHKPMHVLGYGNVKGIDMDFWNRTDSVMADAANIRKPGIFTFFFVGRITKSKGIDELVTAFRRLNREYPETRLLLAGRFEDDLDPISKEGHHIIETCKSIVTLGEKNRDELRTLYAASDCFVFPSYREGFPNVVLEAGAMALPSIVTDINGSREIITKDGSGSQATIDIRDNGVVAPSQDSDSLYEAMKLMLLDNESRERMAGNARNLIGTRFEQGFVRKCLYDYYEQIQQA